MVAEAVEEAVGVGRDAGGGKRYKGTQRGGCALQRHLVEKVSVHIHVEGGVIFDEVAAGLDGDGLAGAGDWQNEIHGDSKRRANLDTLGQVGKTFGSDVDFVWVEGNIRETELTIGITCRGAVESADLVGKVDSGAGNYGSGWDR